MRPLITNALKAITFLALMCMYLYFAGRPAWETLFGRKLAVWFGAGAVIALWLGGQRIGTLEPVSLRPIFVVVGAILMITVFVLMLSTRDFVKQLQRGANIPPTGIALFAFVQLRPGLPEPGPGGAPLMRHGAVVKAGIWHCRSPLDHLAPAKYKSTNESGDSLCFSTCGFGDPILFGSSGCALNYEEASRNRGWGRATVA